MLDTKLKSSKKFSFLIAGSIVILAAVAFIAFYPVLGKQAASYYTDGLRGSDLLRILYQSNLVLYKSMLDKTEKEEVSFSDLYLVTERGKITWEEREEGIWFENERTADSVIKELETVMNDRLMSNWKNETMNLLTLMMDYCVIDHESGEIIKNTGKEIEKLYKEDNLSKDEIPYIYYVMLTYDGKGNLSDISVRDEKPDELLKSVQSFMAGEWIENAFREQMYYSSCRYKETYYFEDGEKLSLQLVDKPKDVTFIYALTEEQKANMRTVWSKNNDFAFHYRMEMRNAYLEAGTMRIYMAVLTVIGLTALLFTRNKRYCLHHLGICKMHLEISLFSMFCVFFMFGYMIVGLVCFTNSGYFPEVYQNYLEFLPEAFYPAMTVLINGGTLLLVFGIWYYLITTLGEVFDTGPKAFVKDRSLIVGFIKGAAGSVRRKKEALKEEILHVDLGGKAEKTIRKLVIVNFVLLAAISFMWVLGWAALVLYSVILYLMLKNYVKKIQEQYHNLFAATRSIADGNLQTEFDKDWGVFESYKVELSKIQNGFKAAVDKEVKSQKMKTELITNVSHDLKTPLTAITTYIELLEDERLSPDQRMEYLTVLKKKSERLKFLIEDLFEVSKASSGNISLTPVDVDICNLMRQVYLEYEDQVEEADLIFRFHIPEEKVILKLDSQKTYRVFENLYVNIIKYAMPHTRVYVNAEKTEKGIEIELKNMSAAELNVAPEDLTERFVRGDSSRNTEGSGLGLAIARSFVELQGGRLQVEIDGDLFKVCISW